MAWLFVAIEGVIVKIVKVVRCEITPVANPVRTVKVVRVSGPDAEALRRNYQAEQLKPSAEEAYSSPPRTAPGTPAGVPISR